MSTKIFAEKDLCMRHNLNGENGDPIISANAQKARMKTKLKMDKDCEQTQLSKGMMFGVEEK